jgi:uncharacterized membrane protein
MPTFRDVNALHRNGLIPPARYFAAASAVRDDAAWATWAGRAILAIGAGHLLAGIVSFFAYNWDDMSAFAKFSTVEGALVIALAGAWFAGIARPLGQMLLIAASILVGVLLAVIGQVYNTDADYHVLFSAWAVLILPWTLASRSAAHWTVWLVVLYFALSLYGEQVLILELPHELGPRNRPRRTRRFILSACELAVRKAVPGWPPAGPASASSSRRSASCSGRPSATSWIGRARSMPRLPSSSPSRSAPSPTGAGCRTSRRPRPSSASPCSSPSRSDTA